MLVKKIIFSIIIILAISAAFFVGQMSNINYVVKTDTKNIAVNTCDVEKNANQSLETLEKAEKLVKQGNFTQATLYFSNAVRQAQGNLAVIQRYHESVLNYCREISNKGEYELVLNLLSDMELFMRAQALYIDSQDIEKLEQSLFEIAEMSVDILLARGDTLLGQITPEIGYAESVEQIDKMKEIFIALHSIDNRLFKDAFLSKINSKIKLLEDSIMNLDKRIMVYQTEANISKLAQRTEQFIENAKEESEQSDFILYYLTSAESLIRQMVLLASETNIGKPQILKLSKSLEKTKKEIAWKQSQQTWQEIKSDVSNMTTQKSFSQIVIRENLTAQQAIEKLMKARNLIAEKAAKLTDLAFIEKAKNFMSKINNLAKEWQEIQVTLYEKWAIRRINRLYNDFKDELKSTKNTNEARVYSAIIKNLGDIDTRYLSTPASTAYNEVFSMFYAALDGEQKIPLSSEMALKKKKPLSDF